MTRLQYSLTSHCFLLLFIEFALLLIAFPQPCGQRAEPSPSSLWAMERIVGASDSSGVWWRARCKSIILAFVQWRVLRALSKTRVQHRVTNHLLHKKWMATTGSFLPFDLGHPRHVILARFFSLTKACTAAGNRRWRDGDLYFICWETRMLQHSGPRRWRPASARGP